MKIKLEKRGCDFWADDTSVIGSDIGNYRVGIYEYAIHGKDGRNYLVEFSRGYKYRTTNKRTGKPLKKAVLEHEIALHIDTQYEEQKTGTNYIGCYRNIALEKALYEMDLKYTKADILKALNYITGKETFTEIEIV